MNILVTGGSGFIGSHLTDQLLTEGHTVTVVDDLSTGSRKNLSHHSTHPGLKFVQSDLGDPELVNHLCDSADMVYHLAAAVGVALIAKYPIQTIHRNIYPTQLLLDELRRQHLSGRSVPLFLASTSEVYGKNPKSIWNESDDLVFGATTKLPIVIGRFFNVVGPRQTGAYGMVLPRFVTAAMQHQPLIVHDDGKQERCFAHVSDVVNAVTTLMKTPESFGRIYNIGSDQPVSILEMAERVVAVLGSNSKIVFQSYADAYDHDFEDIRRRVPDLSRIRQAIGYAPKLGLDQIIADVWRSLRESQPS